MANEMLFLMSNLNFNLPTLLNAQQPKKDGKKK